MYKAELNIRWVIQEYNNYMISGQPIHLVLLQKMIKNHSFHLCLQCS